MATPIEPSPFPRTWDDPERCPFCEADLEDGGPAFVAHLETSPVCAAGFETWRDHVAEDIRGGWAG